jgi:hypothetical protein
MTPLDLRMKYKVETGSYPIYRDRHNSSKQLSYDGALTQAYAQWLENGSLRYRWIYQQDTGEIPVFTDKNAILIYRKAYKEWLENTRGEMNENNKLLE